MPPVHPKVSKGVAQLSKRLLDEGFFHLVRSAGVLHVNAPTSHFEKNLRGLVDGFAAQNNHLIIHYTVLEGEKRRGVTHGVTITLKK
ncbi:hypothetical protein HY993_01280 [Candidatus Micrarchaeota archaeon]|nr:hypothetical protein [Candidatus Micrarchaeota archaeon]